MEEIRIIPGEIRVASADIVLSADVFMVIGADCDSKYPEVHGYGASPGGDGWSVFLHAGEYTLRPDAYYAGQCTEIVLPQRCTGWEVMAVGGRYTVRIAVWKDPR
jgi:hypothetical protein